MAIPFCLGVLVVSVYLAANTYGEENVRGAKKSRYEPLLGAFGDQQAGEIVVTQGRRPNERCQSETPTCVRGCAFFKQGSNRSCMTLSDRNGQRRGAPRVWGIRASSVFQQPSHSSTVACAAGLEESLIKLFDPDRKHISHCIPLTGLISCAALFRRVCAATVDDVRIGQGIRGVTRCEAHLTPILNAVNLSPNVDTPQEFSRPYGTFVFL